MNQLEKSITYLSRNMVSICCILCGSLLLIVGIDGGLYFLLTALIAYDWQYGKLQQLEKAVGFWNAYEKENPRTFPLIDNNFLVRFKNGHVRVISWHGTQWDYSDNYVVGWAEIDGLR